MKKILTLVLALMLAVTANSYAEEAKSRDVESKNMQEKTNIKRESRNDRSEMRDNRYERRDMNGQRSDKMRDMRSQCSSKCGVDEEKVKKCRKEKGFNKENRGDGSCVGEKAKVCMRECMSSKKATMKEQYGKSNNADYDRNKGNNMRKEGNKQKNGKSKTAKEEDSE